ncbi:hypothetical protein GOP47_0011841, partial [Adiantum capillus-veneris]
MKPSLSSFAAAVSLLILVIGSPAHDILPPRHCNRLPSLFIHRKRPHFLCPSTPQLTALSHENSKVPPSLESFPCPRLWSSAFGIPPSTTTGSSFLSDGPSPCPRDCTVIPSLNPAAQVAHFPSPCDSLFSLLCLAGRRLGCSP